METQQIIATEQETIELMFEYDQLRKEILQNDVLAIQTLAGVIVAVAALIGFAAADL